MKRCPNCSQFFDDENFYCLNDGTTLESFQSSQNTPTQFLPSFPTKTVSEKSGNNKIFWLVAALSLVIVALSLVIYTLISKPVSSNQNEQKNDSKAVIQNRSAPENKEIIQPAKPAEAPLTEEAVRRLLDRWEKAQDARNFAAYKSCYASQFFGIKRTKSGSESRMNYAQWLGDRQKMLKNVIDVSMQNPAINIEGDTATARFIQRFQSVNYEDEGQKILKIKMFDSDAKIIYEELKYSY
jgi:ketosteroid isomerase-like protein